MNWESKENKQLIKAILLLKTASEARCFLRDLLTETEIEDIGKRLKTADMLSKGVPYSTIEKETGFSSTTVARVAKWLNTGEGGYSSVLNKIHHRGPTKLGKGLSLTRI